MSHQVVYRKYRSKDFSELIGQSHIAATISNQIKSDSIGHAYLFFGPRGTGKTSTARIFAKTVNCLSPIMEDNYLLPCNKCESCLSFSTDEMDILELDAASNRGIDDARLLKEKVLAQPMSHKYKVIILDEAHMLTREAVNALLKIIEEPPQYIIFIFCTTEFNKIPITIASRCQRFKFLLASHEDLVKKLQKICDLEEIQIDKEKLNIIAKLSKGSFRDSESLLEQILYSDGSYTNELFALYENTEILDKFITAVKTLDTQQVWDVLCEFENLQQADFKQFMDLILDHASDLYKEKKLEFADYLKFIKLNGSFRGDTKEELIYKFSNVVLTPINNMNTANTLNKIEGKTDISVNNKAQDYRPVQNSSALNSNLSSDNNNKELKAKVSSSTLPQENNKTLSVSNFINIFKDKVGIYNILLKSSIDFIENKITINVNSTVSKLFLQKNNLLLLSKPIYPNISDVIINVVKSNSDSNVDMKVNTSKTNESGNNKISDIEDIFKSKFQ